MIPQPWTSLPDPRLTDIDLAAALADQAARLLCHLRTHPPVTDPYQLGHYADQAINTLLVNALSQLRPYDSILSEESPDHPARLSAQRVWIIDPLDGTRGFIQPHCQDWAVHIALWQRDSSQIGHITDAVVILPDHPQGPQLYRSDQSYPRSVSVNQSLRIVVSPRRIPEAAVVLAHHYDCQIIPMHSAGAKAMAVLRGDADAYIHSGGQWEWDSAAPARVLWSSHLHASRLDGSALHYNQANPWLPDLLMCSAHQAAFFLHALHRVNPSNTRI